MGFDFPSSPITGQGYSAYGVDWVYNGYLWKQGVGTAVTPPALAALSLSANTVSESATIGTTVGAILGQTAGSTLTLTGTSGGKFALSGTSINTAAALDYETATTHSITIQETLVGATNTPRDTTFTINVTDVADTLGPFTLAWTSATTELTNLAFSITPSPLVGDVVVLTLSVNSNMSSPFATSAANTIDSTEAASGSLTFTGITTPLSAGLTYARVHIVRGALSADSTTAPITLSAGPVTLAALTLSANTIVEMSAAGTLVGALLGQTSGSALALVDNAGGRFAFDPLPALTLSANTIAENSPAGTVVGAIVGQTPGSTLTIVAGADAGGRFAIGP